MTHRLGDICDIFDGPHATPPETASGPIFLGIKNISEQCELDFTDIKHLSEDDYAIWTKRVTPTEDDIVFSYEATLNRYALIPKGFYGCLGRRLAIVRVKDRTKVNPHYLYHYFCSPGWNAFILANKVVGSTVLRVSVEDFPDYKVDLPDITVQNSVAKILDDIANKRDINNSICAELEETAKLLYDYWFVQFDFPDENGKPYKSSGGKMVWNDELKREIPAWWQAGTLGDVLSTLECGDRPSGGAEQSGIPSIGAENIVGIGRYNYSSEKYVSKEYFQKMKTGVVKSWDVLMYKDGAGVGQTSMFGDGFPYEECAINSHVFILRSDNNLYQDYLYLTLCQEHVMKIIVSLSMKAAQPGLNQPAVKSIPVVVPPNVILTSFNNIVDTIFHKIFACANENQQLASLSDFLLPMLMNGQVKVGKDNET